jgi:hypothetical protein
LREREKDMWKKIDGKISGLTEEIHTWDGG